MNTIYVALAQMRWLAFMVLWLVAGQVWGQAPPNPANLSWVLKNNDNFTTFNNSANGIQAITLDKQGNVYTLGYFIDSISFCSNGVGCTLVDGDGNPNLYISKFSPSGHFLQAIQLENTGLNVSGIYNSYIKVDKNNNIYIASSVFGSVGSLDLDPSNANFIVSTPSGQQQGFFAKYNANMSFVWGSNFGGNGHDHITGIDTDDDLNVYVTGNYSSGGSADIGTSASSPYLISMPSSSLDVIIAKYNLNGQPIWGYSYGGTASDISTDLDVKNGYIYLTGRCNGTIDFDVKGGVFTPIYQHGYIVKYDLDANLEWVNGDNNVGSMCPSCEPELTIDEEGGVYWLFGDNVGNVDVVVSKYNNSGVFQWQNTISSPNGDETGGISTDGNNNVYVSGSVFGTTVFNHTGGSFTIVSGRNNAGNRDAFLVKYSKTGVQSELILGQSRVQAFSPAVAATNCKAYLATNFNDTLTLSTANNVVGRNPNTYGGAIAQFDISADSSLYISPNSTLTANKIPQNVCKDVVFTATPMIAGAYSYRWENGETTQSVTRNAPFAGQAVVTVTSAAGCTDVDSSAVFNVTNNANNYWGFGGSIYSSYNPTVSIGNYGSSSNSAITVCNGESIGYLSGGGGGTIPTCRWIDNNSNVVISHSASLPNITPTQNNSYSVISEAIGTGCADTGTIYVTVGQRPNVIISANKTVQYVCNDVTLTANIAPPGAYSFAWSTGDSTQNITLNNGYSGYAVVTVSDVYGCSSMDTSAVFNVNNLPSLSWGGSISRNSVNIGSIGNGFVDTITICQGDNLSFSGSGGGSPSYLPNIGIYLKDLQTNIVSYNGGNTLGFGFHNISPDTTRTYQVVMSVNGQGGCSDQISTTHVIVTPRPTFTLQASSGNICRPAGDSIYINALCSSGCNGVSYIWERGGTTLSISNTMALHEGRYNYTVTANNSFGCGAFTTFTDACYFNNIVGSGFPNVMRVSDAPVSIPNTLPIYTTVPSFCCGSSVSASAGFSSGNFDPALAGVGRHYVSFSYYEDTAMNCAPFFINDTVDVIPASTPLVLSANSDSLQCGSYVNLRVDSVPLPVVRVVLYNLSRNTSVSYIGYTSNWWNWARGMQRLFLYDYDTVYSGFTSYRVDLYTPDSSRFIGSSNVVTIHRLSYYDSLAHDSVSHSLTINASKTSLCYAGDTVFLYDSLRMNRFNTLSFLHSTTTTQNNMVRVYYYRLTPPYSVQLVTDTVGSPNRIAITQPGTYYAIIGNGCGGESNVITINNSDLSSNVVATPDSILCGIDSVKLIVNTNCVGCVQTPSYSYQANGTALAANSTNVYQNNAPINVVLTVRDSISGCRDTTSYFVSGALANVSISSSATTFCAGGTNTATISISNGSVCSNCQGRLMDNNGNTITAFNSLPATATVTVTGTYYAQVDNCPKISNTVTITNLNLNPLITPIPDTTICTSIDSSTLVATASCTSCQYTWSNGATTNIIRVASASNYVVTISDAGTGCTVTRNQIVNRVFNRIQNFNITRNNVTLGVPTYRVDTFLVLNPSTLSGTSTFPPLSVQGFAGPSVTATPASFTPAAAGIGTHFVSFTYSDSGCTYNIVDTITVASNVVSATFRNIDSVIVNTGDSIYAASEACVGSLLEVNVSNYLFRPTAIRFNDGAGGFIAPTIVNNTFITQDAGNRWNGVFTVSVPSTAFTGTMRLIGGTNDSASIGALIVNNAHLSFTGLLDTSCSNSTYLLTGLPAGTATIYAGFTASYLPANFPNSIQSNLNTGASVQAVGRTFLATSTNFSTGAGTPASRDVVLRYAYLPRYGNGAGRVCRDTIFSYDTTNVRNVNIDSTRFYPVSLSERNVDMDSVQQFVAPSNLGTYTTITYNSTVSGFVTTDTILQPFVATVGNQPLTIRVQNRGCINSLASTINILPAPIFSNLRNLYCNNDLADTVRRDTARFPYNQTIAPAQITTFNEIEIVDSNYIGSLVTACGAVPAQQCYLFSPAMVGTGMGGNARVTVVYRYREQYYNTVSPFNLIGQRSYIVGRATYVTRVDTPEIVRISQRDTLRCPLSGSQTINVNPTGGTIILRQLTGTILDTLTFANVNGAGILINADSLRTNEIGDTLRYSMVYNYISSGCISRDTVNFKIPAPTTADFYTNSNPNQQPANPNPLTYRYCLRDGTDTLQKVSTSLGAVSSFFINSTAVPNRAFDPDVSPALIGTNIVRHTITNVHGCQNILTKTFVVNPMPIVGFDATTRSFLAGNSSRHCIGDPSSTLGIAITPPASGNGSLRIRSILNNAVVNRPNLNFNVDTLLNSSLNTDVVNFVYTFMDTATSCVTADSVTNIRLSRLPVVSFNTLQSVYCSNNNIIPLAPQPANNAAGVGVFSSTVSSPTNGTSNLNIGAETYSPFHVNSEIIRYNYTSNSTGCSNSFSQTVSVQSATIASLTLFPQGAHPARFCLSDNNLYDFLGSAGGQHSSIANSTRFSTNVTASNPSQGINNQTNNVTATTDLMRFRPSDARVGNVVLTYSTQIGACFLSTDLTVQVDTAPRMRIQLPATICEQSNNANLNVFRDNVQVLNGFSFAGQGIRQTNTYPFLAFIPDSIPVNTPRVGSHTLSITDNSTGCATTTTTTVSVLSNPRPTIAGLASSYCQNATLRDTLFGSAPNGFWSCVNCPASIMLSPTASNNFAGQSAIISPAVQSAYPHHLIRFQALYPNNCSNSTIDTIRVNPPLTITVVTPISGSTFCQTQSLQRITATDGLGRNITNNTNFSLIRPITFTVLANGIVNDSFLNPRADSSFTAAQYFIRADYNDPNVGCVASNQNTLINIQPAPIPTLTLVNNVSNGYCIHPTDSAAIQGGNAQSTPLTSATFRSSTGSIRQRLNPFTTADIPLFISRVDTITFIASVGSCTDSITAIIPIRPLPAGLGISGIDSSRLYCDNQGNINILAYPQPLSNQQFSRGVILLRDTATYRDSVSASVRTIILNSLPHLGKYYVEYRYNDPFACAAVIRDSFVLHPTPDASFTTTGRCENDSLILTSNSTISRYNHLDTIIRHVWTYNFQNSPDTTYRTIYPNQPASNSIQGNMARLIVATAAGCVDKEEQWIKIYKYPNASFDVIGGCQGLRVNFDANNTNLLRGLDTITFVEWNFGDGALNQNSALIVNDFTQVKTDTHTYNSAGVFFPSLTISNKGFCTRTDTVRLVVSPQVSLYSTTPHPIIPNTVIPTETPYNEKFNASNGGWYQSLPENEAEWKWGWAIGNRLRSTVDTNRQKLWTTAKAIVGSDTLSTFRGDAGRESWIYSPCFDFTYSQRPMIKMDYASDMRSIIDGASFEYYDENIDTTGRPVGWRRLGRANRGINWYNSENCVSLFPIVDIFENNALHGWSDTSSDWQTARYRMDIFKGKRNVRLRLSFGSALRNDSLNNNGVPKDGFAMDNIWIGERKRNVLVEHFAHTNYPAMSNINQHVYNQVYNAQNIEDVVLVQYHTDYDNSGLATDPYAEASANPGGNARRYYYGITEQGKAIVDGGFWRGKSINLSNETLEYEMLQDPYFEVKAMNSNVLDDTLKLFINQSNNTVSLKATLIALQDMPFSNYSVYPVIIEHYINNNTDTLMAVMRSILPQADGIYLPKSWAKSESYIIDETWQVSTNLPSININMLSGVIFVQDSNSKVYHAATTQNVDVRFIVGSDLIAAAEQANEIFDMNLYPNPSTDYAIIKFEQALSQDYEYKIFAINGILVGQGTAEKGEMQTEFSTQNLPAGVYVVAVWDKQRTSYSQRRLVVIRP